MDLLYGTTDIYEAAYLAALGYPYVSKVRAGHRWVIQFNAVNGIRQASMDYYAGAQVEARKFVDSYRRLKDFVFSEKHDQGQERHVVSQPESAHR